jgi:hypothetical protein
MYGLINPTESLLGRYRMAEVAMRYSDFVPRAYNLAKSLGFNTNKIIPSRAFCSDENQGYPIILIAKHFGAFPFNHGRVGGVVATDRHGPHAHHGKDLVIIHASHVGFDPHTKQYGTYRRLHTEEHVHTSSCGKICGVLDRYVNDYQFARKNIFLSNVNGHYHIRIDNGLLAQTSEQGLQLKLNRLISKNQYGELRAIKSLSTAKVFVLSQLLQDRLPLHELQEGQIQAMGSWFSDDLFYFNSTSNDHIDTNLIDVMQYIVTSSCPALKAAQVNTQVEFDRTYRTIVQEPEYQKKRLLFISGLNVDISPDKGQLFPLTKFIPWAAYYQDGNGHDETWEQTDLHKKLMEQSNQNPDQIEFDDAIMTMGQQEEIKLPS